MRKILLPLLSLGMLTFALLHVVRAQQQGPEVKPPVDPARSPFSRTVAGSGIIEAQTENISIGSPLSGIVTKVHVKVGDRVEVGAPLFRLDDRALKSELAFRQAAQEAAQAQLKRLEQQPRPEELPPSLARVQEAEAKVAEQRDLVRRAREAAQRRAISPEDAELREHGLSLALASLRRAKAEHALLEAGAWNWDREVARASVEQAKAQVEQSRTELDRLVVRALVKGEVLQVNVRPGEFVGTPPGQALVMLGNVSELHVRVDIDENDIPRFHKGAPARATLRGTPHHEFSLRFVRVEPYVVPKKSLTGDSTERVDTRVLQVIYALGPGRESSYKVGDMYVGQQLDVFIEAEVPTVPGR